MANEHESFKHFFQEFEVIFKLNHPNIVKAYEFCFGDSTHSPSYILEYCPNNLKKCIERIQKSERKRIIIELSSAMEKVHSIGIIHRNLKLENILLDEEDHVKLIDFGDYALIKDETESMDRTQNVGSIHFMAPELIQGKKDYNEKVDVYSFGVIVYMILTKGEYPKINILDVGIGKKANIPSNASKFSKELIDKCWSFKPSDSPSFTGICLMLQENEEKLI